MPLPAAYAWGDSPNYGVIDTSLDDGSDHSTDQLPIAGDRVNQMSADIIACHDAESRRREYADAQTSNLVIPASAHDKLYTNTGAGAQVIFTLPTDAEVKRLSFYDTGPGLRVLANTGQTIRIGLGPANVTKTAGYIESEGQGAFISLIRISANIWVSVVPALGWVVEVS